MSNIFKNVLNIANYFGTKVYFCTKVYYSFATFSMNFKIDSLPISLSYLYWAFQIFRLDGSSDILFRRYGVECDETVQLDM